MPHERILPLQHEMVLVREVQEARVDPPRLADVVAGQPLGDGASVVAVAVDDQHGCVPPIGMLRRVVAVPRGRVVPQLHAHVVVEEGAVVRAQHAVEAEDAVVADDRFEFLRERLPGDPVHHVPAVTRPQRDGASGVDEFHRLGDVLVTSDDVVVGTTAPVPYDGVHKCLAEPRRACGVWRDDDVALLGEDGRVPACAP